MWHGKCPCTRACPGAQPPSVKPGSNGDQGTVGSGEGTCLLGDGAGRVVATFLLWIWTVYGGISDDVSNIWGYSPRQVRVYTRDTSACLGGVPGRLCCWAPPFRIIDVAPGDAIISNSNFYRHGTGRLSSWRGYDRVASEPAAEKAKTLRPTNTPSTERRRWRAIHPHFERGSTGNQNTFEGQKLNLK